MTAVQIGDIFRSSWGYDQTNVDFYQVVSLTKSFAVLRELDRQHVQGDGWTGKVVATKDAFRANCEPLRRKILGYGGQACFKIESYAYAYPWNGKPEAYTAYA